MQELKELISRYETFYNDILECSTIPNISLYYFIEDLFKIDEEFKTNLIKKFSFCGEKYDIDIEEYLETEDLGSTIILDLIQFIDENL